MYVQPSEGQLGTTMLASLADPGQGGASALGGAGASPLAAGDAISRFVPPWLSNGMMQNPMQTAFFGPLAGLMQQLMQMLQSMTGYAGNGSANGGSPYGPSQYGCPPYGGEQFFSSATGGSNGDPHLSFNGNTWDNMTSQPDLLNSDSIPGGFQVSTSVTPPNARGVTWNQSATVSMNNGQTTVSLNNAGQPEIQTFGQNVQIADGQTVSLGNGASVTRNQNGSLTVLAQNGYGGQISTTLTASGHGVNVDANASNVDLGGALVAGAQQPPIRTPVDEPISPPVFGPINGPIPTPIGGGPIESPPIFGPIGEPIHGSFPNPQPPIVGAPIVAPHPIAPPPILMHPN